jgi:hypothetical protein
MIRSDAEVQAWWHRKPEADRAELLSRILDETWSTNLKATVMDAQVSRRNGIELGPKVLHQIIKWDLVER